MFDGVDRVVERKRLIGSFRVKVYAEPTRSPARARRLRQACPDEAAAHAALGRMLVEADGGRFLHMIHTLCADRQHVP